MTYSIVMIRVDKLDIYIGARTLKHSKNKSLVHRGISHRTPNYLSTSTMGSAHTISSKENPRFHGLLHTPNSLKNPPPKWVFTLQTTKKNIHYGFCMYDVSRVLRGQHQKAASDRRRDQESAAPVAYYGYCRPPTLLPKIALIICALKIKLMNDRTQ